jgi:hypothetical protein
MNGRSALLVLPVSLLRHSKKRRSFSGEVRAEKVPHRLPVLTARVDAPCSADWFHSYGHATLLLAASSIVQRQWLQFHSVFGLIGNSGDSVGQ